MNMLWRYRPRQLPLQDSSVTHWRALFTITIKTPAEGITFGFAIDYRDYIRVSETRRITAVNLVHLVMLVFKSQ